MPRRSKVTLEFYYRYVSLRYAILSAFVVVLACCDEQEYRLTRYLMANYDASVRPSHNASQPLKVLLQLSLHQLVDVDERKQVLMTNCWLSQVWTDFHLRWNATDFGGIKVIRFPVSHVWKPDIVLYNNADASSGSALLSTNVIVNSTGEVTWVAHAIFKSSCDINVGYFPFDVQHCHMKFASWTYDSNQVELSEASRCGDVTRYQSNGEFELDELSCQRHSTVHPCCPDLSYDDVTYVLKLRRRPLYHVINLILPCTLINAVALLVFYLPSESGEKVSVGMGSLLTLSVFILMVRQSLPPSHTTPLLSYYYGASICLVSLVTCLSVLTLGLHHKGSCGAEVPPCLQKLVLGYLAKILLLRFGDNKNAAENSDNKNKDFPPPHVDISGSQSVIREDTDHLERYNYSPCFARRKYYPTSTLPQTPRQQHSPIQQHSADVTRSEDFERHFLRVLNKIYETIDKSDIRSAEQERKETIRSEWHQVALVCDRFLFTVFAVAMAAITFALLFSSQ